MGKTVTTFLIDGTPQGPRYVTLSNRDCKMYVIPRDKLSILSDREELQTPSLYILLGEDEHGEKAAYIGQTENFRDRVRQHDARKDFWHTVLVFISQNQAITKSDVLYLEHAAIELATKKGSYHMNENRQATRQPHLQEHQIDSAKEFFKDVRFLAAFVSCGVFEEGAKPLHRQKPAGEIVFHLKEISKGSDAQMVVRDNKYIVLKGSVLTAVIPDYSSERDRKLHSQQIEQHAKEVNGITVTIHDVEFDTPSGAGHFIRGCATNGWVRWKDADGVTLDKHFRNKD